MDDNYSTSEITERNSRHKVRFATVMLCDKDDPDVIIDLIARQLPRVHVVYRRLDTRPLWITTEPPRQGQFG